MSLRSQFMKEGIKMSVQSQEKNMRKLANLLSRDLSYIWGERESGPKGDKRCF